MQHVRRGLETSRRYRGDAGILGNQCKISSLCYPVHTPRVTLTTPAELETSKWEQLLVMYKCEPGFISPEQLHGSIRFGGRLISHSLRLSYNDVHNAIKASAEKIKTEFGESQSSTSQSLRSGDMHQSVGRMLMLQLRHCLSPLAEEVSSPLESCVRSAR